VFYNAHPQLIKNLSYSSQVNLCYHKRKQKENKARGNAVSQVSLLLAGLVKIYIYVQDADQAIKHVFKIPLKFISISHKLCINNKFRDFDSHSLSSFAFTLCMIKNIG